MQIRGIIFDFNGTMFFDTEKQEETWRKMLKEVTGRDVTGRELKEHMHGRRNKDIFEYFLGKPLTEEEADRLVSRKEAMYRAMCVEDLAHFCFVDGLTELLDELKACGIQRTIATGSEQENVDFFEEYLHLHNWFDLDKIVCTDGSFACKPAPDIYEIAAQKIGVPVAECIVVEDSISGILSAKAAHAAKVIGIVSAQTEEELLAIGADAVIRDFYGFSRFLDESDCADTSAGSAAGVTTAANP